MSFVNSRYRTIVLVRGCLNERVCPRDRVEFKLKVWMRGREHCTVTILLKNGGCFYLVVEEYQKNCLGDT